VNAPFSRGVLFTDFGGNCSKQYRQSQTKRAGQPCVINFNFFDCIQASPIGQALIKRNLLRPR